MVNTGILLLRFVLGSSQIKNYIRTGVVSNFLMYLVRGWHLLCRKENSMKFSKTVLILCFKQFLIDKFPIHTGFIIENMRKWFLTNCLSFLAFWHSNPCHFCWLIFCIEMEKNLSISSFLGNDVNLEKNLNKIHLAIPLKQWSHCLLKTFKRQTNFLLV